MKEDKIVYAYNWKELIMITRSASGVWRYNYNRKDILDRINKNRKKERKKLYTLNITDSFDVGAIFGYKLNSLLRRCQISYGDIPDENNLD